MKTYWATKYESRRENEFWATCHNISNLFDGCWHPLLKAFTDVLISKQTTLRGSWIRKLQCSCVHGQNAKTSQIFLPALCQMKYKSFYELLNQLESDDKLRDSERGQLTTDRDRNGQNKSSNEEISSVYKPVFRTNIRSWVWSNQRDDIFTRSNEAHSISKYHWLQVMIT